MPVLVGLRPGWFFNDLVVFFRCRSLFSPFFIGDPTKLLTISWLCSSSFFQLSIKAVSSGFFMVFLICSTASSIIPVTSLLSFPYSAFENLNLVTSF